MAAESDGDCLPCDYSALNSATVPNSYPIPHFHDFCNSLWGKRSSPSPFSYECITASLSHRRKFQRLPSQCRLTHTNSSACLLDQEIQLIHYKRSCTKCYVVSVSFSCILMTSSLPIRTDTNIASISSSSFNAFRNMTFLSLPPKVFFLHHLSNSLVK